MSGGIVLVRGDAQQRRGSEEEDDGQYPPRRHPGTNE